MAMQRHAILKNIELFEILQNLTQDIASLKINYTRTLITSKRLALENQELQRNITKLMG